MEKDKKGIEEGGVRKKKKKDEKESTSLMSPTTNQITENNTRPLRDALLIIHKKYRVRKEQLSTQKSLCFFFFLLVLIGWGWRDDNLHYLNRQINIFPLIFAGVTLIYGATNLFFLFLYA